MNVELFDHLTAELERLDLLLHREILRLRAGYQLALDEFRGLYIGDDQVDSLVAQQLDDDGRLFGPDELTSRAEECRQTIATRFRDVDLPWHRLAARFELDEHDRDILLLALAPELHLKYETIYAYLNNDIARRWPTRDMALRLFAHTPDKRRRLRARLLPGAPLIDRGLLQPIATSDDRPSWLAQGFATAPIVATFVLDIPLADPALTPIIHWNVEASPDDFPVADKVRRALRRLPALLSQGSDIAPVILFEGPRGTGKRWAARNVCADLDVPVAALDLSTAWESDVAHRLALRRRISPIGIYLHGLYAAADHDGRLAPHVAMIIDALATTPGPLFLAVEPGVRWSDAVLERRILRLSFSGVDHHHRSAAWRAGLQRVGEKMDDETIGALADQFALSPGQIYDVVQAALDAHSIFDCVEEPLSVHALFEAARGSADRGLGELAPKVTSMFGWDDLVLPPVTLRQVRAVAAAVRFRHLVYDEWGFAARVAAGSGVKALFAGPPGTGKTMTASVIARDLGLDIYKVDLATVVSKYIGETEKNLDRIFRAARMSSAILFFDEADALFGKRSEVTDAHDRYANIEVAFLLQQLEMHEGAVILATNARKHIDDAFSRRLHYVVEFPLPDEEQRLHLWRGMFPKSVPLGRDVDLPFLARQFSIAGGDIRNVALDSAFLAAAAGQDVTMRHLIAAMARQSIKQGRIPSASDFKGYHAWIAEET